MPIRIGAHRPAACGVVLFVLFAPIMPAVAQNVVLPIGAIIDWWRPTAATPLPDGFVIADGGTVSDPRSPLNGMTVPDLRGKFVKGAQNVAAIGATGGSAQHVHHVVMGHVHEWGMTRYNPHDGKTQWLTWTQPMAVNTTLVTIWSNGLGDEGSGLFPMAPFQPRNSDYYTDGQISANSFELTDPASSEPPYMELLKLVKVR